MTASRLLPSAALALSLLGLAACSSSRPVAETEYQDYRYKGGEQGKLFSDQGLVLGVGKNSDASRDTGGALGVNAYLWRGALDTLPSCRSPRPIRSAG